MPQTRQHIQQSYSQQRQRHSQTGDVGVRLTREGMERFMTVCQAEGRVEGTLKWYRRGLNRLYDDLPEDKTIRRGTLEHWREQLVKEGYAPSTINSYLSVNNAYLDFVGHREYQLANQLKLATELQPELTRAEYLRLLQTARTLGRERVYLLVKLFGSTGLTVQELDKVTVESVRDGKLTVIFSRSKRVLHIPEGLQRELLEYARRNGYISGPIFLTKEGTPMSRTYVSTIIRQLCTAARVPEEKGNPRCLKRLYQNTLAGIEDNVALLVEQAHSRLLEQEQLDIGWKEG